MTLWSLSWNKRFFCVFFLVCFCLDPGICNEPVWVQEGQAEMSQEEPSSGCCQCLRHHRVQWRQLGGTAASRELEERMKKQTNGPLSCRPPCCVVIAVVFWFLFYLVGFFLLLSSYCSLPSVLLFSFVLPFVPNVVPLFSFVHILKNKQTFVAECFVCFVCCYFCVYVSLFSLFCSYIVFFLLSSALSFSYPIFKSIEYLGFPLFFLSFFIPQIISWFILS